jgi:hypothetical protein
MPDNLTSLLQPVMSVTGREIRAQSVVLVQHSGSRRWNPVGLGEASAEGLRANSSRTPPLAVTDEVLKKKKGTPDESRALAIRLRSHWMCPPIEDESRQENTGGPPPMRSPSRAVA